MISDIPPLDGLRLLAAALRPGQYLPADIRGETVHYSGMAVSHTDEVVVQYEDRKQQADAERVKSWLRERGYKRTFAYRIQPELVELGGEGGGA